MKVIPKIIEGPILYVLAAWGGDFPSPQRAVINIRSTLGLPMVESAGRTSDSGVYGGDDPALTVEPTMRTHNAFRHFQLKIAKCVDV